MSGRFGFIGLGNMGGPMAANLAGAAGAAGALVVYDKAGTAALAPAGAEIAGSAAEVAARAETVILSLPDGAVSRAVADEIAGAPSRATRTVVETSTIGIAAAQGIHAALAEAGVGYIDAPVSGGARGARAGTIAMMCAGPKDAIEALRPSLGAMAKNIFHVGEAPGLGQAMKLVNNFLSATALAATSEAIEVGRRHGLEPATMIEVLNVSTGRNSATSDKFPNRVLTGTYDAGFMTPLMTKDLILFRECLRTAGAPGQVSEAVVDLWTRVNESLPGSDFTEIYKYVRAGEGRPEAGA